MKHYPNPIILIIIFLTFFMIINPSETVAAASNGFKLWYSVLVPALLPFFIVTELMVNLGLVRFIGVILEPIIRPIFKLPGSSSVVIVMGFTSGFPMGAILCKKLYEEKMLTADETERLVSFTNNSSPLFIIGAVGVGMFGSPVYGYLLAVSHYLANLLIGIIWSFKASSPAKNNPQTYPFKTAYQELLLTKTKSMGKLLGDAIKNSLNNIIAIAGFIIFFSVLVKMLVIWNILDWFALTLAYFIPHITPQLAYGLGMGIFEITLGINTIAMTNSEILIKLVVVSIILAFSGLSIIAQVMSVVAATPVRLSFYIKTRVLQMGLSSIFTYIGYQIFLHKQVIETFTVPYYKILYSFNVWNFSVICMVIGLCIITLLMILSCWLKLNNLLHLKHN